MTRAKRPDRPGSLRLIGGRLGGRRLPIPEQPGLRPTGARPRETLFNWLQPVIVGSHCLDAFAGTGALGFEAISRGAQRVVMIERNRQLVTHLRASAAALNLRSSDPDGAGVEILHADSLSWLASAAPSPFDIVFLDPPFAEQRLAAAFEQLVRRPWLKAQALVYVETDARLPFPPLPPHWTWRREQTAGQVRFALALSQ